MLECKFGSLLAEKAIVYYGEIINVMLYKLFLKMGLQDLKQMRMTLHLADRSVRCLQGIMSDQSVKGGQQAIPDQFCDLGCERGCRGLDHSRPTISCHFPCSLRCSRGEYDTSHLQ